MVRRLYKLCIRATARILMRCNRRIEVEQIYREDPDNPFCAFPSIVVEDLMKTICRFSTELVFSHVFLLLNSSKMTRLSLPDDVEIQPKVARDIFCALHVWGYKLISISINVSTSRYGSTLRYHPEICRALDNLLRITKRLTILVSNIAFQLYLLNNFTHLEKLVINFRITDQFSQYLFHPLYRHGRRVPGINDNEALRILRIINTSHAQTMFEDMTQIIKKCKEIVEIEYDVLANFNLLAQSCRRIKKYKIQKTCLGEIRPARREDMHAVSLQCPDLSWVDFFPDDYGAITALSQFPKLSFVTLTAKSDSSDNFHFGLRPLLEDDGFGSRLTNLIFHNVVNVDLTIIAACCPNLEELGAFRFTEDVSNAEYPPNSFSKVTSVVLEHAGLVPTEKVSVVGILSNAPLLEILTIERAANLDDETLDVILRSNTVAFSKIILINMYCTMLTEEGLHKILRAIVSDGNYDRFRRVQIHSQLLRLEYSKGIINSYIRAR